ncbi:hypothetical protein DB35_00590 [Streptomyces abyssalis]|uniref:DUF4034 domain-containing protein n=1 Tax=Streptomyces abyssalis TaxID=933944 RepID=A0A1E7JVI0_9ACTN|nr:hypothetical protein [Streptomyces abyssalis]OEU94470.1 hypothetical protein AN215_00540 [Streptomyces abyssalis]OEU95853.1 hypothetical protein DB35_00590 [Streptomyces abyssalis]OEV06728.1 hypothetical protein AN219_33675 [Streptomyces nanshensis]
MRRTTGGAGRGIRPVYSPAGFDNELRGALEELRAGRWVAMRMLLDRTGTSWGLRTARSQVLGVVAAGSQVVEAWLQEDPRNADARMMSARVAVERAVRARREHHFSAGELEKAARLECHAAAELLPADPVPWVCLLALARLDERQERGEHRERAAEPMLPPGPWGLLYRVYERDRYNREAHHRMLHFLHARSEGSFSTHASAVDFVRWVSSWAPAGSALLALPLYAYVEQYRRQIAEGKDDPLLRQQWAHDPVALDARTALQGWFDHTDPTSQSVLDLNHLAHALWAGKRAADAARVFAALGPYFTQQPWLQVAEDPERPESARAEYCRAREESFAADS